MLAAGAAAVLMMSSIGPRATAETPGELEVLPAVGVGRPVPQPIAFSHKIHAGELGMNCLYCHIGADEGPAATIPAVQTCMGCHKIVAQGRPEIDKLQQYWDNQQPIPWVKVHDIPDHARFLHNRHVKAGVECQTCHGPVQAMEQIRLVQTLNMGFCVTCHKANLNQPENPTSLDCATCHK
jgi:predicted CXXCH cytochrome family protein